MEYMKDIPDNYFELAIVDPPYGIGEDGKKNHNRGSDSRQNKNKRNTRNTSVPSTKFKPKKWDQKIPPPEYFTELFRVSKKQIIWGGNYFIEYLKNTSCIIVWDKDNGTTDFADCELAWTSFKTAVRKYKFTWNGMLQQNMKNKEQRIHPTQKPVKLYEWLLINYAKKGDKIFDSHLGSGSIAIACHNLGFDLEACEIDEEYFAAAQQRLKIHQMQVRLF